MRRSRLVGFLSSLVLAAGTALTGAATAGAAQHAAADGYVALGDSYSSGVGAGSYIASSGDCKRSTKAHPYLWAAANSPSSFDFTACSGARTGDVLAGQLGPLGSTTGLVSISVGGNDAGFADVMMTCVLQSDSSCLSGSPPRRRTSTRRSPATSTTSTPRSATGPPTPTSSSSATRASTGSAPPASASPRPSGRRSTTPPTTSTPRSPSAPPTTASPSATYGPPSAVTRSAPAAPGCTV